MIFSQWGATPLEDNLPTDNYHYQVTVQTGMKKKSGTSSKISFVMSGETNDSGARRLYDGHRKVLMNIYKPHVIKFKVQFFKLR